MEKLSLQEQVLADVDDEIYLMKKRMQLKYSFRWGKARDLVNNSILTLYTYLVSKKRKR